MMKIRNYYYLSVISICLFVIPFITSCEEAFSPLDPVNEQYVLFCALSVSPDAGFNTYKVTANISKVFQAEDFNPSGSSAGQYVKGGTVFFSVSGKSFELKQQMKIDKTNPSMWDTQYVYSASGVEIRGGNKIAISAKMPNGKALSAQTQVPTELELKMSYPFQEGFSSAIDRFLWGNSLTITWKPLTLGHLFFPKLEVFYYNDADKNYEFLEIPSKYISSEGNSVPYYPLCQYQTSVSFDFNSVDSVLSKIAASDPDRKNKIYFMRCSMMEFDTPLSNYYSGIHGKLDHFSIRLDEDLYTNIKGGIGVLGVGCISKTDKIKFREDYLQKFGYQYFEY